MDLFFSDVMKMKLNIVALLAFIGLVAATTGKTLKIEWGHITLLSVVAFLVGWWLFGLVGAIIIAVIVMVLMGIIKYG